MSREIRGDRRGKNLPACETVCERVGDDIVIETPLGNRLPELLRINRNLRLCRGRQKHVDRQYLEDALVWLGIERA